MGSGEECKIGECRRRRWASATSAYNDSVERDVFESDKRAVVYLDLLGFAALVEANPQYFATEPFDHPSLRTGPPNAAAQRLTLFHQVLESNIAAEQPNHATVFSDCGFGVFYTPRACAEFAVALMQDFLRVKVPVRMGLGFGTFSALGTTSSINGRSTVVRAMFGGTSIVRAVAAERCGGKGMRIFADRSFSELFKVKRGDRGPRFLPIPEELKSVSCELDYISGAEPEKIDKWLASIRQMAHSAAAEVQNHYSETLAAISRMLVSDVDNADEGCRD